MNTDKIAIYSAAINKYFGTVSLSINANLKRDGYQFDLYDVEKDMHVKVIPDPDQEWAEEYKAFDENYNALFVLDGKDFCPAEVRRDIWAMCLPIEVIPYRQYSIPATVLKKIADKWNEKVSKMRL